MKQEDRTLFALRIKNKRLYRWVLQRSSKLHRITSIKLPFKWRNIMHLDPPGTKQKIKTKTDI